MSGQVYLFVMLIFFIVSGADVCSRDVKLYFRTAIAHFLPRINLEKFSEPNRQDFQFIYIVLKHFTKLRSDILFVKFYMDFYELAVQLLLQHWFFYKYFILS